MILKKIKISELTALTQSAEYANWKQLPISPARALSQSLNPDARPDDIALIIALDELKSDLIGFIGALPSVAQSPEPSRVAWVTNWWVSGNHRGKGIAQMLLINLLEVWGNVLCFQDLTLPTLKIIEKKDLFQTIRKLGVVVYVRPGLVNRLKKACYSAAKNNVFYSAVIYSGLLWLIDQMGNFTLFFPQQIWIRSINSPKPKVISTPSLQDFEFIKANSTDNFHVPRPEEFEMSPWLVKPSPEMRFLSEKYPYSSFARSFSSFWLRWENDGQINALLFVTLREGVLKTQYVYCNDEFAKILPAALLTYCFSNMKVDTLMTAHGFLPEFYISSRLPVLKKRKFTRYLAVSKDIMMNFKIEPVFHDGEGDYKFT